MDRNRAIRMVQEYIQKELTGNVTVEKNVHPGIVLFTWKKNDKTVYAETFQYAFSFVELEQAINPLMFGEKFVDAYNRSKGEIAIFDEPEEIQSVTEETVELEIEEGVDPEPEEDEELVEPDEPDEEETE